MKTGHGCEDVSRCECGYIEDEEFELPENWEEGFKPKATTQVIFFGNS